MVITFLYRKSNYSLLPPALQRRLVADSGRLGGPSRGGNRPRSSLWGWRPGTPAGPAEVSAAPRTTCCHGAQARVAWGDCINEPPCFVKHTLCSFRQHLPVAVAFLC